MYKMWLTKVLRSKSHSKQKSLPSWAFFMWNENVDEWNLPILSADKKCHPLGKRWSSAFLLTSLDSNGFGLFCLTNSCIPTVAWDNRGRTEQSTSSISPFDRAFILVPNEKTEGKMNDFLDWFIMFWGWANLIPDKSVEMFVLFTSLTNVWYWARRITFLSWESGSAQKGCFIKFSRLLSQNWSRFAKDLLSKKKTFSENV